MPRTRTHITDLSVIPCLEHHGRDTIIGTAIEEFFLIVNEAALLFSWYLREAGGVPARHHELRIIARDDPAEIEARSEFSPNSWDFETMDALADFSILYLPDDQREAAALGWLHAAVHEQAVRWGSPTDRLDQAYRAALALDPGLVTPRGRDAITALGDDPDLPEADFWALIDLLTGTADDTGCRRLTRALSERGPAVIDGFGRLLDTALAMLDTAEHLDPPIDEDAPPFDSELPFSTDTFLYVRCDVVASGRATWLHVVNNPVAMVGPWNIVSERLLEVVPSLRPASGPSPLRWPRP